MGSNELANLIHLPLSPNREKAPGDLLLPTPSSPPSRHPLHLQTRRPKVLLLVLAVPLLVLAVSHYHGVGLRPRRDSGWSYSDAVSPSQTSHVAEWLASDPPNNGTIPFQPSIFPPIIPHRPLEPTLSVKGFSTACADRWISLGELCPELKGAWAGDRGPQIDIVYAWTNGSSAERMAQWREAAGNRVSKRFRDHDELRHSLRSATNAFDPSSLRAVHLVVSDTPACRPSDVSCLEQPNLEWEAQVPHWINLTEVEFATPSGFSGRSETRLVVQPLSALFKRTPITDFRQSNNATVESGSEEIQKVEVRDDLESRWRNRVLPSFNSLSVESQIVNIADAADTILYLNDDAFVMRKLAVSDIASPIAGPVFRMSRATRLPGIAPENTFEAGDSEWRGLHYTNWLLDQRFGKRNRPYLVHQAKSVSLPILREAQGVFVDQITATAASHFRGQAPLEVVSMFLVLHYQIEKHREALLWSFFFGRSDLDQDGFYTLSERAALLASLDFHSTSITASTIRVPRPIRTTICGFSENYDHVGLERPKETSLLFTSADGFSGFLPPGANPGSTPWPTFHDDGSTRKDIVCEIDVHACFGDAFTSSSPNVRTPVVDAFRRVAHTNPTCGDCIIVQLVRKSGSKGLSAFLPPPPPTSSRRHPSTPPEVAAVGLGTSSYNLLDFSLPPSPLPIRERCVALIQRYSYIIGDSSSTFIQGVSPNVLKDALSKMHSEDTMPAFLTINDDLRETDPESTIEAFNDELHRWFGENLGLKTRWEM